MQPSPRMNELEPIVPNVKRRSLVVVLAIVVGVAAAVLILLGVVVASLVTVGY